MGGKSQTYWREKRRNWLKSTELLNTEQHHQGRYNLKYPSSPTAKSKKSTFSSAPRRTNTDELLLSGVHREIIAIFSARILILLVGCFGWAEQANRFWTYHCACSIKGKHGVYRKHRDNIQNGKNKCTHLHECVWHYIRRERNKENEQKAAKPVSDS